MKKLILLLIPLLFLSSCTIDWNDEQAKKITELEKQVSEMKSDKDLEIRKFEFEKQKYSEQKEAGENKKIEAYHQECVTILKEHQEWTIERVTTLCHDAACVKQISDINKWPSDFVETCSQKKADGIWEGE